MSGCYPSCPQQPNCGNNPSCENCELYSQHNQDSLGKAFNLNNGAFIETDKHRNRQAILKSRGSKGWDLYCEKAKTANSGVEGPMRPYEAFRKVNDPRQKFIEFVKWVRCLKCLKSFLPSPSFFFVVVGFLCACVCVSVSSRFCI